MHRRILRPPTFLVLVLSMKLVGCPSLTELTQHHELPRSGSRLKLIAEEGSGLQLITGLYDSLLGVRCTPRRTSDGELRCLPSRVGFVRGVFADAECTVPLGVYDSSFDCDPLPPGYAIRLDVLDATSCEYDRTVFRTGEELASTVLVFRSGDAGCEPFEQRPFERYFRVQPVEVSEFARLDIRPFDAAGRLRRHVFEGEDGARLFSHWEDQERGEACSAGTDISGEQRCFPNSSRVMSTLFSDESCTTEVGFTPSGACVPSYAHRIVSAQCDALRWSVYEVGEERPWSSTIHQRSGSDDSCMPTTLDLAASYREFGREIPPDEFESMRTISWREGGLELEAVGSVGREMPRWFTSAFGGCHRWMASDGRMRCIPVASFVIPLAFRDESCSIPLRIAESPCGEMLAVEDTHSCDDRRRTVYRLSTSPFDTMTPVFTRTVVDTCVRYDPFRPTLQYYETEREIPPESFPLLDERIIP